MRLLNKQKTDLFSIIKNNGFNPIQFKLNERDGDEAASVQFEKSDYFFSVYYLDQREIPVEKPWIVNVCPSTVTYRGTTEHEAWRGVVFYFQKWLARLKEELDNPDPWAALGEQPMPNFEPSGGHGNTPLQYVEWEQASQGLEKIRTLLLNHTEGMDIAVSNINQQIDTLIESGKRMGRVDWFNQAIGAIMSIFISLSLTAEVQHQTWDLLKKATEGIVYLVPALMGGSGLLN